MIWGEKEKKIANCLSWRLRVENRSAAICDSVRVTVKSKFQHVYKTSQQLQNFIFSIIRVDNSPKSLILQSYSIGPSVVPGRASLLVATWADMSVFADKHTGDFWQQSG